MSCAKISYNCVQFHQNRRELQYSVPQKPQYRQACYAVQRLHLPTVTAHHLQYKASLMTASKHNNIQQTYITTTYQPCEIATQIFCKQAGGTYYTGYT